MQPPFPRLSKKAKYLSDIKSLQGHVLFINAKNAEDAKKLQKKLEEYSANCHEYEKVLSVLLKRFCVHCSDFIHRYPVWDSCILAKIERLVKELNKNYLEETIIALKKLDKSIKQDVLNVHINTINALKGYSFEKS